MPNSLRAEIPFRCRFGFVNDPENEEGNQRGAMGSHTAGKAWMITLPIGPAAMRAKAWGN
jgi:hypothetical protein